MEDDNCCLQIIVHFFTFLCAHKRLPNLFKILKCRKSKKKLGDVIFKHLTNFCVLVWVKRLATDFKSTDFQWIPSQMGNFTLNVPTYLDAFL